MWGLFKRLFRYIHPPGRPIFDADPRGQADRRAPTDDDFEELDGYLSSYNEQRPWTTDGNGTGTLEVDTADDTVQYEFTPLDVEPGLTAISESVICDHCNRATEVRMLSLSITDPACPYCGYPLTDDQVGCL